MAEAQTAAHVLMIRPVRFAANSQTAASNHFQQPADRDEQELQALALREFDALTQALRAAGVGVVVFEDTDDPHTPDSIFPNNWVSLHADGSALLYPMLAPNRRLERRPELLDALVLDGFRIERIIELTHHEGQGGYLEGTGSVVLDRVNHVAYACLSPRTHLSVLEAFASNLQYEIVTFDASDAAGAPIYHTNVMLSIGCRLAVVCASSVLAEQRPRLLQRLQASGRDVLQLTQEQLQAFAGNLLELRTSTGEPVIAMSEQARRALTSEQQTMLEKLGGRIISVPIPTIERVGGGSVRCMLTEIHLPRVPQQVLSNIS